MSPLLCALEQAWCRHDVRSFHDAGLPTLRSSVSVIGSSLLLRRYRPPVIDGVAQRNGSDVGNDSVPLGAVGADATNDGETSRLLGAGDMAASSSTAPLPAAWASHKSGNSDIESGNGGRATAAAALARPSPVLPSRRMTAGASKPSAPKALPKKKNAGQLA